MGEKKETLDEATDELKDQEDRTPGEKLEEGVEELKEKATGEDDKDSP